MLTAVLPLLAIVAFSNWASAATAVTPGSLVITEVMPNPAYASMGKGEWFEIFNASGGSINLEGLVVRGQSGESFTIQDTFWFGTGDYAVIGAEGDDTGVRRMHVVYDRSQMSLDNSSDSISLVSEGVVVDSVSYDSSFRVQWGASLTLDPTLLTASENDSGASWCSAMSTFGTGNLGTPGTANDACPQSLDALLPGELLISELLIIPSRGDSGEWFEVRNTTAGTLRLDRTIEVSVTNTGEKKRLLRRLGPNLETLARIEQHGAGDPPEAATDAGAGHAAV